MFSVDASLVRLGLSAANKADAIRQVAAILSDAGCIDPAYADSMLSREKQTATYLGNGIAIPHGLRGDGAMIRRTAVAVAQFPRGVTWNDGEIVHLAVGIAAASDEHIQVLANLTTLLQDEATARRLGLTDNPNDILRALGTDPATIATADTLPANAPPADAEAEIAIDGASGLHARPATLFASLARQFSADIRVSLGAKTANGKAMASLLTLGAETGSRLRIAATGPDAQAALEALVAAVKDGLGENEEDDDQGAPAVDPLRKLVFAGDARTGIGASPGIAQAPLFHLRHQDIEVGDTPAGTADEERDRLSQALADARRQLQALHAEVSARSGSRKAAIFLAHQELLDDPDLAGETDALIVAGHAAAWAWQTATQNRAGELAALQDPLLAARAQDVRDVGERVLRLLTGLPDMSTAAVLPAHPVVLLARDLTPSDTAGLDPKRVLALITAGGGSTSHTAIIARGLGLPAVVGAGEAILDLADGTPVIVDGDGGQVVVNPSAEDRALAEQALADRQAASQVAARDAYRPAATRDGRRIEVVANVGSVAETEQVATLGGEGVGLLRTEFLFLSRDTPPDEEEQFQVLRQMTQALRGLPLIVRTLDIGGDKEVPYLHLPREDNPFLGIRGIRLCLERPDLFEPQLRAIARAAAQAAPDSVRVMFPMVADIEEFRTARTILHQTCEAFGAPRVACGIMIEVPSAALMADTFAREVDFFSIGTNDLTQYTLAMDRLHPGLTRKADALHPAVLRLIGTVVEAAHAHGRWVGLCGNLGAEPAAAPILVGLGVDELSVSPPALAGLKALIRTLDMPRAKALAQRALACATADAVRALA